MNLSLTAFLRASISFRAVLLAAAHTKTQSQDTCDLDSKSGGHCNDKNMPGDESWKNAKSVYEFNAKDIDGNDVSLEKYRGQVLMIVNVACKCGFTNDHYTELAAMHEKFKDKGFSILGFPCNQFMHQEPGSEAEIKEFVKQFNVVFDMFSKIEVNGSGAHPLFKYLKEKQGGTLVDAIKWNFTKFVVDREGQPVGRYSPQTSPKELHDVIQKLL